MIDVQPIADTRVRARAFRLIPYGEYDAVTNMAVDEVLLDQHLLGKSPPTLRFYGWTPPAVSFGYGQKVAAETIERIQKAGYGVVRRPTGGRAVLHEGELTYCFVASSKAEMESEVETGNEPILEASVARAYRQICDALITGLVELGVEASLGKSADGSYKSYEDCFQATTQADLQYQGKKIVGSAQLRRRNAVLQHGSIMINQAQDKMAQLLGTKSSTRDIDATAPEQGDNQRHFNLNEILKSEVSRSTLEDAIGKGFTRAFDCRFAVYDINDEEWALVEKAKNEPGRTL